MNQNGLWNGRAILEDILAVFTKLHMRLLYDLVIILLGSCAYELKTYVHKKIVPEYRHQFHS